MGADVTNLVKLHLEAYIEKIEEVLKKTSDGLETPEFTRKRDEIFTHTKKLLAMEIKKKISQNEPIDVHLCTLETQIHNYWKDVLEKNNKNLSKRRAKDEEERNATVEEANEPEDCRIHFRLVEKAGTSKKSKEMVSVSTSGNVKRKQLPPLAFQLQHSVIKMGMLINDKPETLKNTSGENSTPFVVGLTNEGELQYGGDVFADVLQKQDGPLFQSKFKKYWWVADFFLASGNEPWTDCIQSKSSDGTIRKISVEFLLAFILKKLKEQVETDQRGRCSIAVITVPFWFSSTQRIQVKDGASLAGFPEVYLTNETAAAAYACASSLTQSSPDNYILIISENSKVIDASVYECSYWAKTVKLVGHYGYNYMEKSEGVSNGIIDSLAKVVLLFWNGRGKERVNEDEKLQTVRKLCNVAIEEAKEAKHNSLSERSIPIVVFVTSESEQWRPILKQVGKEFSRLIRDINEETAVVVGAALLSRNPKYIGNKVIDGLAFDVVRKCGIESGTRVIPKTEILPNQTMKFSTVFPINKKEGEIFQIVHGCNLSVGSLRMNSILSSNQFIEICLTISNEAIVMLADVIINSRTSSSKEYARWSDYDWITPNLTQEEMAKLQSHLESLGTEQEASARTIAK